MSAVLPPMSASDEVIAIPAREIAAEHGIPLDASLLEEQLADDSNAGDQRISALEFLVKDPATRSDAIRKAVLAEDQALRSRGLELAGVWKLDEAHDWLASALGSTSGTDRQSAIRAMGYMDDERSLETLRSRLEQLDMEEPLLALDVLESSRMRNHPEMKTTIEWWDQPGEGGHSRAYELAGAGGNPFIGRDIVFYDSGATCLRCHRIDGTGGVAGPDLTDVGARLDSTRLLTSLLDPGAEIAEGFGEASAMPAVTPHLNPTQMRDVVAYLQTLRDTPN